MSFKSNPSYWTNWLNSGGQSQQQRDTVNGIYKPKWEYGDPLGGYAMGNPVLTANTGFTGSDGNKVGIGGGQVVRQDIPKNQLLAARPDLAENFHEVMDMDRFQYATTPTPKKVAPANTANAARSQSLRDFGAAKAAQRYSTANTRTKAAQEGGSNG